MEQDRFKVDVLVWKNDAQDFLFMANFNVPRENLRDGSLPARLGTIRACIEEEFAFEIPLGRVLFSVSACYSLVHAETGEQKLWTGSFQPRANRSTQLRPFRRYAPNNFATEVTAAVDEASVLQTLSWLGDDTKWTFEDLKSAIICFQARCRNAHHPFHPSRLVPQQQIAKLSRRHRGSQYKLYLDN